MIRKKILDVRIFALLCVLLGGMGQGVVAPNLPHMLKEADQLAFASGVSAALMYLGIFVSTFRYGKWADEGKVHWLLGGGLIAYAATLLLLGVTHAPWAIFLARFLEGLSLSGIYVAADFVLGRLSSSKDRGQWLSYYGVALSVGLLLGPALALGSAKLLTYDGLRLPASSLGISSSEHSTLFPLMIVAAFALLFAWRGAHTKVPRVTDAHGPKSTLNRGALIAGAAYGYMEAGLVAVFPVLAITEFHVTAEYCLFVVILSAAFSSILWGTLSDKKGPKPIVYLLLAALGIGPLLLWLTSGLYDSTTLAYLASAGFGAVAGGLYPVGFSWLLQSLPESEYGFASGGFARAYGLGSLFGPVTVGLSCQLWGARGMWATMAIVGILALCFMVRSQNSNSKKLTSAALL